MPSPIRPWPYAAKAVIQFRFRVDRLELWVTFRHPMNENLMPPAAAFVFKVDGVDKIPLLGVWRSPWTIAFIILNIPANPARVLSTYLGPLDTLVTTWGKQWEPWDRIICIDVPYGWEHILEVDPENTRVTINGQFVLSTATVTTGTYPNYDVSDLNVLFLNCSAGPIVFRGFQGGVNGQLLFLSRLCATVNDVTLSHDHPLGFQPIFLHAGADETLRGEYGGWVLVCNGTNWYDVSHAKHV